MQFDHAIGGDYAVEIMNLSGQVIHTRNLRLQESTMISFQLATAPPAGVYFLRAKEQSSGKVYSGKLIIR